MQLNLFLADLFKLYSPLNGKCCTPDKLLFRVLCGVPQGSVLGPLLFLLYINDISKVSSKLFTVLFADDSNMFISGSDVHELIDTLNDELKKVVTWLNTNKLSLNVLKSHYMIFSTKNVVCSNAVNISGHELEKVNFTKFLGVIIDTKLSWKFHINYIKGKVSKGVGILCKAKKILTCSSLTTLYYSFIYPYLSYCVEIWGCTYKTYLKPLFLIQKKVVRMITFSSFRQHTLPLFNKLQILNIYQLTSFKICIFMHKYENDALPLNFKHMFTRVNNVHSYNTRQTQHFRIPIIRNNYVKHSLKYFAIKLYNHIIPHIEFTVSLSVFKKRVKVFIMSNDLPIY